MTRRRWRTLTSERLFFPERECEQFRMRLRQDLLKRVQEGWLLRYGWKASRRDFCWSRSVIRIGVWSIYERNFCVALADLVAMLLEGRQRLDTLHALELSQKLISAQLADASSYVRSQLPANLSDSVRTDWRYMPSSALGGDALDCFWIDDDHLVIFVLDVVGHGVGSALLAISILHLLRQRALKDGDPLDPVSVLTALNRSFQMDEHGDKVFSIWYGVFDRVSGIIRYASAGHPPALLISPGHHGEHEVVWLKATGLWIGATSVETSEGGTAVVAQDAELFVFSDGLYELSTTGGPMIGLEGFGQILVETHNSGDADLEKSVSGGKPHTRIGPIRR